MYVDLVKLQGYRELHRAYIQKVDNMLVSKQFKEQ